MYLYLLFNTFVEKNAMMKIYMNIFWALMCFDLFSYIIKKVKNKIWTSQRSLTKTLMNDFNTKYWSFSYDIVMSLRWRVLFVQVFTNYFLYRIQVFYRYSTTSLASMSENFVQRLAYSILKALSKDTFMILV